MLPLGHDRRKKSERSHINVEVRSKLGHAPVILN